VPSLATVYEPYFPIGAAVEPQTLLSQGNLLAAQVNSLVAENAMKWERIHPRPGDDPSSYDFTGADAIVEFARAHGMRLRGHTFVWHNQVPPWVFQDSSGQASKTDVLQRMRGHMSALLAHFRGEVYCWDVVNEAVTDTGEWRADSPWFRAAGADDDGDGVPDYIVQAFEHARATAPGVKLFYNDYNIEGGAKLDRVVSLVKALRGRGVVDGVGIQGHWSLYGPGPELVRSAIERLAALDVEVQVTELDLSVYRPGDSSSLAELSPGLAAEQASRYASYFKVFRDEAEARRLTAVTFWGIADDHTWLDSFPVTGRKDWPLLFDTHHRPKSAFRAVAQW